VTLGGNRFLIILKPPMKVKYKNLTQLKLRTRITGWFLLFKTMLPLALVFVMIILSSKTLGKEDNRKLNNLYKHEVDVLFEHLYEMEGQFIVLKNNAYNTIDTLKLFKEDIHQYLLEKEVEIRLLYRKIEDKVNELQNEMNSLKSLTKEELEKITDAIGYINVFISKIKTLIGHLESAVEQLKKLCSYLNSLDNKVREIVTNVESVVEIVKPFINKVKEVIEKLEEVVKKTKEQVEKIKNFLANLTQIDIPSVDEDKIPDASNLTFSIDEISLDFVCDSLNELHKFLEQEVIENIEDLIPNFKKVFDKIEEIENKLKGDYKEIKGDLEDLVQPPDLSRIKNLRDSLKTLFVDPPLEMEAILLSYYDELKIAKTKINDELNIRKTELRPWAKAFILILTIWLLFKFVVYLIYIKKNLTLAIQLIKGEDIEFSFKNF